MAALLPGIWNPSRLLGARPVVLPCEFTHCDLALPEGKARGNTAGRDEDGHSWVALLYGSPV